MQTVGGDGDEARTESEKHDGHERVQIFKDLEVQYLLLLSL